MGVLANEQPFLKKLGASVPNSRFLVLGTVLVTLLNSVHVKKHCPAFVDSWWQASFKKKGVCSECPASVSEAWAVLLKNARPWVNCRTRWDRCETSVEVELHNQNDDLSGALVTKTLKIYRKETNFLFIYVLKYWSSVKQIIMIFTLQR